MTKLEILIEPVESNLTLMDDIDNLLTDEGLQFEIENAIEEILQKWLKRDDDLRIEVM